MTEQELTKLVAEKVMGWEHGAMDDHITRFTVGVGCLLVSHPGTLHVAFAPLLSDNDALQVVDKMIEKGFTFSLIFSGYASKSWDATFYGVDEYSEQLVYDATHESRCRAICLAALKAVGEVVE